MTVFPNTRAVLRSFCLDVSGKLACVNVFGWQVTGEFSEKVGITQLFVVATLVAFHWFVYQQWKTQLIWIKRRTTANALIAFCRGGRNCGRCSSSVFCLCFSEMFYRFNFSILHIDEILPYISLVDKHILLRWVGWCDNVCHFASFLSQGNGWVWMILCHPCVGHLSPLT